MANLCVIFLVAYFSLSTANSLTLNIGLIFTDSGSSWGFWRSASSISLALEDYQNQTGRLTNVTLRPIIGYGFCDAGQILYMMSDWYFSDKRPDVVFGLGCSGASLHVLLYLSYWNIPVFSHGSTSSLITNKDYYNTIIRINPPGSQVAKSCLELFRLYNWRRAAMITQNNNFCDLTAIGIYHTLKDGGVLVTEWIRPKGYLEEDEFDVLEQYVEQVMQRARIFIICIGGSARVEFLKIAHRKGVRAPHFVILEFSISPPTDWSLAPWTSYVPDEDVPHVRQIFLETNYKRVQLLGIDTDDYTEFFEEIPGRYTLPPWTTAGINTSIAIINDWIGTYKTVDVYDSAIVYFKVLDEILSRGGDTRDGDQYREIVANRIFQGIRGKLTFDENADLVPNYVVQDIQEGWETYKLALIVKLSEPDPSKRFASINNLTIQWGSEGNVPPLDAPKCGFQNEFCSTDNSGNVPMIIGLVTGGLVILIIVTVGVYLYRKHQEELLLEQTVWKVDFSEVKVGKARAGSVANMSRKSIHSDGSKDDNEGVQQMFTEVGVYRENQVAILRANTSNITISPYDMRELKMMKDMKHTNIANFVGLSVEPPNICCLMTYYTKGSLLDIIENEVVGLDWMFKSSLLSDLAEGMSYLHRSELLSHGSLKSTCCLVDSRWQLKISSYGLQVFKEAQTTENMGEYEKYRKMLWTAPELLRMSAEERPRYGTQAGDVYSFAVIAQEVIYRAPPYFIEVESPRDFIRKLRKAKPVPFRPDLPKLEQDVPKKSTELIRKCWVEQPDERPSFDKVIKMIKALNQGKKMDIMESLIEKLERYANNLEDIVKERTEELIVEKKKTDKLLESMLPVSVVEQLKRGQTVDAELFDSVTIFFSDVVGFSQLSLESSPIEIVDFLNDVYTVFDDIIGKHDVYKMETISDSYMVVSGLPKRNGDKHVGEIANLALDLMSTSLKFKIRHRQNLQLNLRIGFHTGSCAAGVVGLSMPRYCLFGDTVNMASRMETNGKALMIHMSQDAFEALNNLNAGYVIKPRGQMQIKGKGMQMTYWLTGKSGYNKELPLFLG